MEKVNGKKKLGEKQQATTKCRKGIAIIKKCG